MLLTRTQASAVYGAMTYANNIGAKLQIQLPIESGPYEGHVLQIAENENGTITVFMVSPGSVFLVGDVEEYENQAQFAQAYGIE